ncbi:sigma-70 family RNA polymerase sigma factor [Streptomyces odontomachi]|uniref:sigma-70 family RNA polymerase sigma factor n=1 Tax=Streptomyces odontomachi TaxID=2944940 RepID=UPI00210A0E0D|nr:sigma-70 family RNA polymerase sigma factor [Streptomyces sp. ODS25]
MGTQRRGSGAGGSDALARRFEAHRDHLRAVAYRMLGSSAEADDAVQEAWLRLSRVDADAIDNLPGWLTTVVSRICLDMLRARRARPEEPVGHRPPDGGVTAGGGVASGGVSGSRSRSGSGLGLGSGEVSTPEDEAVLIDSVGRALLVVLDRLGPAERAAFVLHDLFAVPFEEIAVILDRSRAAAKKLASRARQRVRGTPAVPAADLARQRGVVDAFLAAARHGDIEALLAVLAPDVVRHADPAALPPGAPAETRGAEAVGRETVQLARNAQVAAVALIDGRPGLVVAPHGRLRLALTVTVTATVEGDRIAEYTVHADPERLRALDVAVPAD